MPKKSEGPPIPVGTLVRVKRTALTKGMYNIPVNSNAVEEHGWLWFVREYRDMRGEGMSPVYTCKSLATGDNYEWLPNEIEEGGE